MYAVMPESRSPCVTLKTDRSQAVVTRDAAVVPARGIVGELDEVHAAWRHDSNPGHDNVAARRASRVTKLVILFEQLGANRPRDYGIGAKDLCCN